MRIVEVQIHGSRLYGDGGFVRLRRCQAVNLREDGSESVPYDLDLVERPGRCDAVAVVPYHRATGQVVLRRGLRPAVTLARADEPPRSGAVLPSLHHLEAVAGILEPSDRGEAGLRARAAAELLEEAGIALGARGVQPLGPPVYLCPGLMAEQIFFCCAELERPPTELMVAPRGDGIPLEEGSEVVVAPLDRALRWCDAGRIRDAKTEVALRRLRGRLERGA